MKHLEPPCSSSHQFGKTKTCIFSDPSLKLSLQSFPSQRPGETKSPKILLVLLHLCTPSNPSLPRYEEVSFWPLPLRNCWDKHPSRNLMLRYHCVPCHFTAGWPHAWRGGTPGADYQRSAGSWKPMEKGKDFIMVILGRHWLWESFG